MAHALLSPSGASRWMACPPSARFELNFADSDSEASREGTLAHALGEWLINKALGAVSKLKVNREITKIKAHELYQPEMMTYCKDYRDFILEQFSEAVAESKDAVIFVEKKVDISKYAKESFGTIDNPIVSSKMLRVNDLKYGKGVPVYAKGNKQLRMYALGAHEMFKDQFDYEQVQMSIYQPRLNNITTETIDVYDLTRWGVRELRPAANLAYEGHGQFKSGEHCKFCRGKARCRTLAEDVQTLVQFDFQTENMLPDDAISAAMELGPLLMDWFKAVKDYATAQALGGKKFKDFKLVHGRSVRKYSNENQVIEKLLENGYTRKEIFNQKLIGITEMERLLGIDGMSEILQNLIIKPAGAPALVHESDVRGQYKSAKLAFGDFIEE